MCKFFNISLSPFPMKITRNSKLVLYSYLFACKCSYVDRVSKYLDLSCSNISNVPEAYISALKDSKIVDLSFNIFKEIPGSVLQSKNITELDLSENKIESLPENIDNLENIEILNLAGSRIASLPESFGNLQKLKNLILDRNVFPVLPKNFTNLKNLEALEIRYTPMKKLADNFGDLKSLKKLVLVYNNFFYIPESFSNLVNLVELNLSLNDIFKLPEIFDRMSKLAILRINSSILVKLPESIGNLKNLAYCSLEGNLIEELPESIGNLIRLEKLSLNDNNIEYLPSTIGNLISLRSLYLSNNNLSYLPRSLFNLKKLRYLTLEKNLFTELPDLFDRLATLENINLSRNMLKTVPSSIGILPNIYSINLSKNRLTSVPASFVNLKSKLIVLDLTGNEIDEEGRDGNLGRKELIEIFGDRVKLGKRSSYEKDVYVSLKKNSIGWNFDFLKNCKTEEINTGVSSEKIELMMKNLFDKGVLVEYYYELMTNYVKMLFSEEDAYFNEDRLIKNTVIDLIGDIIENLILTSENSFLLDSLIRVIEQSIKQSNLNKIIADLRVISSILKVETKNGGKLVLDQFVDSIIAAKKESITDSNVFYHIIDLYVFDTLINPNILCRMSCNFKKSILKSCLGEKLGFEPSEDIVQFPKGPIIKKFLGLFSPESVILLLTEYINRSKRMIEELKSIIISSGIDEMVLFTEEGVTEQAVMSYLIERKILFKREAY